MWKTDKWKFEHAGFSDTGLLVEEVDLEVVRYLPAPTSGTSTIPTTPTLGIPNSQRSTSIQDASHVAMAAKIQLIIASPLITATYPAFGAVTAIDITLELVYCPVLVLY
jgi:hypothetical protein